MRFKNEKDVCISQSTSKAVKMMFQQDTFNWNYIQEVQTHVLELPYVNNELSMFILLPDDISDDGTGLEMVCKKKYFDDLHLVCFPDTRCVYNLLWILPIFVSACLHSILFSWLYAKPQKWAKGFKAVASFHVL